MYLVGALDPPEKQQCCGYVQVHCLAWAKVIHKVAATLQPVAVSTTATCYCTHTGTLKALQDSHTEAYQVQKKF